MAEKIAVIGAGISGLTAARGLVDAGHRVTIFEKSGGTGGRLSTRRTDFGSFDHGAQYVTAKSTLFQDHLERWTNEGAVDQWRPNGKTGAHKWYVGRPGMSSLVKPMTKGLEIRKRTRICEISRHKDQIICGDETGATESFTRVIVSIPSPQALDLLGAVDPVFNRLSEVTYLPCWTAMFAFQEPIESLPDYYRGEHNQSVSWFARNTSKPDRSGSETFLVQAGGNWSEDHLEDPKEDILLEMKKELEAKAGAPLTPDYSAIHRWRYALVTKALGQDYLASSDARIFAIGDGLLGGRVEAAFESARGLLDHLKNEVL